MHAPDHALDPLMSRIRKPRLGFSATWLVLGLALSQLALWTCPERAQAKTTLAGDFDLAQPTSAPWADTGWGFGVRLGQELHVPLMSLNPEIGFTWHGFGTGDRNLSRDDPSSYRGIAGLRIGLGEIFRAGVSGHVGIGRVDAHINLEDISHTAFTWDVGAFLELTALPILNVGVHANYIKVASNEAKNALQWFALGAHAAILF